MNLVHRGLVAGVDEAGRGPLAGPVVAAAVILNSEQKISGLRDSKKLCEARREELSAQILATSWRWGLAWADTAEIDSLNILQASMLAMQRAVLRLGLTPTHIQVDGNRCPVFAHCGLECTVDTIVGGDDIVPAISAASIIAKVARDHMMRQLDIMYPVYGFAAHKGYPTIAHRAALKKHGPCPVHRSSFAPVKSML